MTQRIRIIGGYARGLILKSPPTKPGVKPTMDRVREAIFDTIGSVEGKCVVDLFAATGALGLEACSRGASKVAWFEHDSDLVRIIELNLSNLLTYIPPPLPITRIFHQDVLQAPHLLSDWTPDIILADPPYHPLPQQKGSAHLLADVHFQKWASSALIVLEQSKQNLPSVHLFQPYSIIGIRTYGNQMVYYLRVKNGG